MSTAWEQLEGAALSLARSGPIKDRLTDAYRNHLALINPEELPAALRAEFHACHDALTRERPLRGEDAVRATVRKMSNQDADLVARAVVRLFAAMAREAPVETPLGVTESVVDATLSGGPLMNGAHGNGNGAHGSGNGAHGSGAHDNAVNAARAALRNGAPQVVPLYAAEA
jgi:hypothetical protein